MIKRNDCFAYRPEWKRKPCDALSSTAYADIRKQGLCGTEGCPFYKPMEKHREDTVSRMRKVNGHDDK